MAFQFDGFNALDAFHGAFPGGFQIAAGPRPRAERGCAAGAAACQPPAAFSMPAAPWCRCHVPMLPGGPAAAGAWD